jgi:hypothetical protein
MRTKFLVSKLRGKIQVAVFIAVKIIEEVNSYMGERGVDRRIILKWILEK